LNLDKLRIDVALGAFIILMIVAMASYKFGVSRRSQNDLTLSDDVKAYIDSKYSGGAAANCADVPKLLETLSALEIKLAYATQVKEESAKFMKSREEFEKKKDQITTREDYMKQARSQELLKLKMEILPICAAEAGPGRPPGGR
jgi:uncharacterized protein YdcH (DUF465 family)